MRRNRKIEFDEASFTLTYCVCLPASVVSPFLYSVMFSFYTSFLFFLFFAFSFFSSLFFCFFGLQTSSFPVMVVPPGSTVRPTATGLVEATVLLSLM